MITQNEDLGKFILSFTVGFLMLFHGYAKLTHGIGFIEAMMVKNGFPTFMAYGAYLGEIIAPLMLIIGFRVKIASVLIIATMIGAIVMVHAGDVFAVTKHGAWAIELQMFYILACLAIFFQGAGKYSIDELRV